jgi:hypothetical protein
LSKCWPRHCRANGLLLMRPVQIAATPPLMEDLRHACNRSPDLPKKRARAMVVTIGVDRLSAALSVGRVRFNVTMSRLQRCGFFRPLPRLENRLFLTNVTILNSGYPTPVEKGRICAGCLRLLGALPCLCSLQCTKRRVSVHASHGRGSKLAVELRLPSRSTMHQRKQKACAS